MHKILVCGGRDFDDWDYLENILNIFLDLYGEFELIHGDARGADRMAQKWAKSESTINHLWGESILVHSYPADWDKHGKAAGPIRNSLMLKENPDIDWVVAFPGGNGTADMIKKAKQHKKNVNPDLKIMALKDV